jgi:hypothetical protein
MNTRRKIVAGMAGGAAVVLGAALYRFTGLFASRYPPTPYDDVLARLINREQAAKLGAAALRGMPGFSAARAAARLRAAFGAGGLSVAATIDVVNGRIMEANGWLLPQSVALLAALAAKA